jgi:hypothetical protein
VITTREDADDLWGRDVVERAFAEPNPTPYSERYDLFVHDRIAELPYAAFRLWALSQSWPDFCLVVRIVCGTARDELTRVVH